AQLDGLARQILARPPVERGAHLGLLEREVQAATFHGFEHARRFLDDFRSNAVTADQRDPVVGHSTQPSPRRSRRLRLLGSVSARTSFSPRLAADPLSPRLRATPFGSNCHACGIDPTLASRRPGAVVQLEERAASQLEHQVVLAASMRTATSMASSMLSGFAMPFHARSKAVPWSTETRRKGSPTVTLTPETPVH